VRKYIFIHLKVPTQGIILISLSRFRWVVCQLDVLGKCLTVPMLQAALKSLPSTLDETYGRILRNIDEAWSQSVARILEWLVFSATPLRLTEVAELVAIDIDDDPPFDPNRRLPEPRDILTMCSSLITMTKEKSKEGANGKVNFEDMTHEYDDYEDIDSTFDSEHSGDDNVAEESKIIVRLAHFSVKEYLISRQVQVGPTIQYRILEVPVNTRIAEICLLYLFQFDRPDSLTAQTLELFPLLRYAARNWVTHARIAGTNSDRLNSLIMTLFLEQRETYTNWIRIFDPERVSERPLVWQYAVQPCSPLYYCSLGGLLEPAKRLIEHDADVKLSEGDLGSSLLAALKNEHEDIARLLVDSGADVAASAPNWPVGMTALHCAARDGYEFLAAELLSKGAAVDAKTDTGETPLHMAVENGHIKIASQLLDHGANIEAQDNVGKVPLYDAIVNKDRAMVELFLGKGAALEVKDLLGRTIVLIAVETGQLDIIHILLEKAPNIQVADIRGQALIHYAAASGLPTIVKQCMNDIERQDNSGRTALHVAANAGHEDVVQLLVQAGANIEARTISGQTPLYCAAVAGDTNIVQQLIDSGANMKARDNYGASILYAAATAGEQAEAVVDLFLAKIEQASNMGRTLLHHAALAGDTNMVERLIERGMDLDARTVDGETAIYLAMIRGHDDIVQLLRRAKMGITSEDIYNDKTDDSENTKEEF
jgi:ankyrin repeat protein